MDPQSRIRKLAAIMFTDIVGYTAMMQENEQAAAKVRERHREVFNHCHEKFNGEVLQYYGDGTLSIFQSAIDAVRSAIQMQQNLGQGVKVPLRIGIHLGDIVIGGNEIYGDGVNLASRVESLGVAGNILLSDKVQDQTRNQSGIETKSLGHFEFKNINQPVEVFAICNPGIIVPAPNELQGKLKERKKSIAVLPFVNLSSDPENEYFSDGISEEILNALVKVDGLQVTARTSSFVFKGKKIDIREIARVLGVKYVLEGSVRKAGNRVRITAQLINSTDGFHLFSENYDRNLEDIFAVQDEIAITISNQLRVLLGETERDQALIKAPTDNLEAYENYLKGVFHFNQWGDLASTMAKPYLEKAVELEPDFEKAHSYLGGCYLFFAFGGKISWAKAYDQGMVHIRKALELNSGSFETLQWLAAFQTFCEWDWAALKETADKLLRLAPGDAKTYHPVSTYYCVIGQIERAIELEEIGLRLDPVSVQLNFYYGLFQSWSGNHKLANVYYNKVLDIVPGHRPAIEFKGLDCILTGEYEKALEYFNSISEFGYRLHRSTLIGYTYAKMGEREKALECLKYLENFDKTSEAFILQNLAVLHAGLGHISESIDHLLKAIEMKTGDTMMFHLDPFLQPIKTDPRYDQLFEKAGLKGIVSK